MPSEFYTLKGYKLKEPNNITEAMEDYLEMIYRITKNSEMVTVKDLSFQLNVKPSSVSKMANRLRELELVDFEKYGKIHLTKEGNELGKYYLYRHNILKKFFRFLNKKKYNLQQIEKIEHFIDHETIYNMDLFLKQNRPS